MSGGRFSVEAIFTAIDRMGAPVAGMTRTLDRFTRSTTIGLGHVDRAFGGVHSAMVRTAGAVGAVGVAAGGGLVALSKSALSVEEAMAKVSTVITPAMGSVQTALDATKAAAVAWSRTHVASVEEFLAASYNMSSAGLNSAQALAGTRAALTLATATMGDATTAGNLLATVYNNLGDKTRGADQEMNRLGDVLAKTQALFQIADLAQLNESLKMGAPSAIQYGQSLEQLSTVLGALNTAGLQGSMAGTAYSASMRQMAKASKDLGFGLARSATGSLDFIGTLGNIEKKFGKFDQMSDKTKAAFQKAFGDEGLRSIALLMGKNDELVASLSKVTNATGTAAAAQATIEAARSQKLAIFGNQLRASTIAFGDAILPVMDELRPEIDKVIAGIGGWSEANKGLVASKIIETVRGVRDNLPEIVTWLERIGKGALAFYAFSAGIKTVQGAVTVVRGVNSAFVGAQKTVEYFATSGTAGNKAYTATLGTMRMASIAAGHGLGEMRGALNATGMAKSINGVTGLLGKAGLLGAALGVGYALGTWLDQTFGFSKMLSDAVAKMTGLEDKLNEGGKRFTTREGARAAGFVNDGPAKPFDMRPTVPGFDMMADAATDGSASVTPMLVTSGQMDARTLAQELAVQLEHRQVVDVNVHADAGTNAEVSKAPARGQRTKLKLPASGKPR
jgi:TP901 family phage tail tape measure protein